MDIISYSLARDAKRTAETVAETLSQFPRGIYYKGETTWSELISKTDAEVGDAWTVSDKDNQEYAYAEDGEWKLLTSGYTGATALVRGYYYNNKFYSDAAHTHELVNDDTNAYIDLATYKLYTYTENVGFKAVAPETLNVTADSGFYYQGSTNTTATGRLGVSRGNLCIASGVRATAIGNGAKATAESAVAIGVNVTNNGNFAAGIGHTITISGQDDFGAGYNLQITQPHASALGIGLVNNAYAGCRIGKWNVDNTSALFQVGNGTDDTHRSNAFEVSVDGYVTSAKSGDATHTNCLISYDDAKTLSESIATTLSHSIIKPSTKSGDTGNGVVFASPYSTDNCRAAANCSLSRGSNARVTETTSEFSTAIGKDVTVTGAGSMGHGRNITVNANHGFALGYDLINSTDTTFVVGRHNVDNKNLFVVGNGTSSTNRSNAFEVLAKGAIKIGTTEVTEDDAKQIGIQSKIYELDESRSVEGKDAPKLTPEELYSIYTDVVTNNKNVILKWVYLSSGSFHDYKMFTFTGIDVDDIVGGVFDIWFTCGGTLARYSRGPGFSEYIEPEVKHFQFI